MLPVEPVLVLPVPELVPLPVVVPPVVVPPVVVPPVATSSSHAEIVNATPPDAPHSACAQALTVVPS